MKQISIDTRFMPGLRFQAARLQIIELCRSPFLVHIILRFYVSI